MVDMNIKKKLWETFRMWNSIRALASLHCKQMVCSNFHISITTKYLNIFLVYTCAKCKKTECKCQTVHTCARSCLTFLTVCLHFAI